MIVKKLRIKHRWSQEQLAELCGLNVRTIQRVESGNKASIETLKCLASVFDVDISKLTEEVTVIDKDSDDWKTLPWWYRANMLGARSRRSVLFIEVSCLILGFVYWFIIPDIEKTMILFLGAYATGWLVRYGDQKQVW